MSRMLLPLRVLIIAGALVSLLSRPIVSLSQFRLVGQGAETLALDENTVLRYTFTAITLLLL